MQPYLYLLATLCNSKKSLTLQLQKKFENYIYLYYKLQLVGRQENKYPFEQILQPKIK